MSFRYLSVLFNNKLTFYDLTLHTVCSQLPSNINPATANSGFILSAGDTCWHFFCYVRRYVRLVTSSSPRATVPCSGKVDLLEMKWIRWSKHQPLHWYQTKKLHCVGQTSLLQISLNIYYPNLVKKNTNHAKLALLTGIHKSTTQDISNILSNYKRFNFVQILDGVHTSQLSTETRQ